MTNDTYFRAHNLKQPDRRSCRFSRISLVVVIGLQMLAALFTACGSPSAKQPSKTLASIRVSPTSPTVPVGSTEQLTAVGTFSDGTQSDVSSSVAWSSSDPTLASIDHSGLIRGIALGRPQITAASSTIEGSTIVILVAAATPSVARFAYVTGQSFDPPTFQGTVSTYTIKPSTGQLRESGYVATGTIEGPVVIDPRNAFAYVLNGSFAIPPAASMISVFSIDAANGRLAPVAGSPFPTGEPSVSTIVIEPRGQFLYAACASGKVLAFAIDQATGALTPPLGGPALTGANLSLASVDPAGQFLYVADNTSFVLWAFNIDQLTGTLSVIAGSPFKGGGSGMTIDFSGHLLYAVSGDIVFAFTIDPLSGALQKLPSDPNASSTFNTSGIALDPTGKFLYVAHDSLGSGSSSDYIAAFKIDSDGGVTQKPQQFPTSRVIPGSLRFDPTGKLLFVSEAGSSIESFSVGDSGSLTSLGLVQTPSTDENNLTLSVGATAVVYEPQFAYVADAASNDVKAYTIDHATGALNLTAVVAAATPSSVAVDPFGHFAYVTQAGNNSVGAYSIDATTGALSPIASIASGSHPISEHVEPSGRFLYVANRDSNDVSMYTINMTTGVLSSMGTIAAGSTPVALTIDPTGQFALVANQGSSDVSVYSIDVSTGLLTSDGTLDSTMNPTLPPSDMSGRYSIAVDVSGKFLYTGGRSGLISTYSGNVVLPFFAPEGTVSAGASPIVVATEPSARFVYASETNANFVHVFSANRGNGTLASIQTVATGASPVSLVVEPSGTFDYTANKDSGDVSIFTIDALTGLLTPDGTVTTGGQPVSIVTTATIR